MVGLLIAARPVATRAQDNPPVAWAWSGAVTSNSARVVARVATGITQARLVITPERAGATSRTQPATGYARPDAHSVIAFPIANLEQATRYRYRVETPDSPGLEGRFRTYGNGPFSFRLAFASCASTASNHVVFDAIREKAPDLFVHMGDFHYLNIGRNDPDAFRRAYDRVLDSRRQSALYRATPIAYVYDDHDFGSDNADGTARSRSAATGVYRERVPHYPLVEGNDGTIQQAFSIGRVRLIITDTRAARSPVDAPIDRRTMLGAAQLAWFEGELIKARDAPLVVWINTVPWITSSNERTIEGWAPYARERTRIADHIDGLGLTSRIVMLSGDGHMAAIDDGSHSAYMSSRQDNTRGFVVAHGAPMDRWPRTKGGPYSHGVSRRNHQFGLLDVKDSGSALDVTVSARNARGDVVPGLELVLRCEKSVCAVTR
ncbi:MAG: alkaline phosphatase family protein [Actinomycetota bacterium]|nr:alkaline phosphatase family protein [Actinomycetota bacterium]